jgi:hypothetical protein
MRTAGTINIIPPSSSRVINKVVKKNLKAFFEPEMDMSERMVSPVSDAFFAIAIAPAVKKDCIKISIRTNNRIKSIDNIIFSDNPFPNVERISFWERVAVSTTFPVFEAKSKILNNTKNRTKRIRSTKKLRMNGIQIFKFLHLFCNYSLIDHKNIASIQAHMKLFSDTYAEDIYIFFYFLRTEQQVIICKENSK